VNIVYNTLGWQNQPVDEALSGLAAVGYAAVELAAGHASLPPSLWTQAEARRLRGLADDLGLALPSFDLSAPFLLSDTAHEPSFTSLYASQRDLRVDLVCRAIEFAADLDIGLICLPSGLLAPDMPRSSALCHLMDSLEICALHAREYKVRIGIKPAAGHVIESYADYLDLWRNWDDPAFELCYDAAHGHRLFEDLPAVLGDAADLSILRVSELAARSGALGDSGEMGIDFGEIFPALKAAHYKGFISIAIADQGLSPECAARQVLYALPPATSLSSDHLTAT